MASKLAQGGEIAIQLPASSDATELEQDLIVPTGSSVFLDGQGRTIKTYTQNARFWFHVMDGASLCLYNLKLVGPSEGRGVWGETHDGVRTSFSALVCAIIRRVHTGIFSSLISSLPLYVAWHTRACFHKIRASISSAYHVQKSAIGLGSFADREPQYCTKDHGQKTRVSAR